MSLLSRLLRSRPDPREEMRPLWHRIVKIAREPQWYARHGVADTVAGRFDMITAILCAVLVRMESEPALAGPAARLTELFVEDMDGQLRESGVGDVVVGKHIGRLMSVLGGRLGAYREALTGEESALSQALARNVTLAAPGSPDGLAAELQGLAGKLSSLADSALLAGEIPR